MKSSSTFAGKLIRRRGADYLVIPDEVLALLGRPKTFDMTVENGAVRLRGKTLRRVRGVKRRARAGGKA